MILNIINGLPKSNDKEMSVGIGSDNGYIIPMTSFSEDPYNKLLYSKMILSGSDYVKPKSICIDYTRSINKALELQNANQDKYPTLYDDTKYILSYCTASYEKRIDDSYESYAIDNGVFERSFAYIINIVLDDELEAIITNKDKYIAIDVTVIY
jgi:hypothetical protein